MLNDKDFERAAAQLKVPAAHIKAVCEVEAPQGGFDSTGQPRILFEAHRFAKLTGGLYNKTNPDISAASWDRSLYARGANADERNANEHKRLQKAVALNRRAALMSASWGKFQILGENFAACGFATLQDFINAMYASEGRQLDAFIGFVGGDSHKCEALRSGDWKRFAASYNGAAYAQNQYDTKLAAAAKKYG